MVFITGRFQPTCQTQSGGFNRSSRYFRTNFYFSEYGLLDEHFRMNNAEYLQAGEAKVRCYHHAALPFMYTTFNDEPDLEEVVVEKLALATIDL